MASALGASEGLKVQGYSTLRAWRAGMLGRLLEDGCSLSAAQVVLRRRGALAYRHTAPNVVTTAGKGLVADMLIDAGDVGLTYHALGTSITPVGVGDSLLGFEVARKAYTLRSKGGNVATFSVFYLAAECDFNIREVGQFGGATATSSPDTGVLFSRILQSLDNSSGEFDLTFDYDLTIG